MKNTGFLGVKLISYYNLILSTLFILGSIILIIFSVLNDLTNLTNRNIHLFSLLGLILLSLFYIFSSLQYLHHKRIGRIFLIYSFITQILISIGGLIATLSVEQSFSTTNIVILVVGLIGLWYLNTEEAKEWLHMG